MVGWKTAFDDKLVILQTKNCKGSKSFHKSPFAVFAKHQEKRVTIKE